MTVWLPDVKPQEYRVVVAKGTDLHAYVAGLDPVVRPLGLGARANPGGHSDVLLAPNRLTGFPTVTVVAMAAFGVLNALVLQTRERVRELVVHKAIEMTLRQAVAVVLSSLVLIGLVGRALGVPLGTALHVGLIPGAAAYRG